MDDKRTARFGDWVGIAVGNALVWVGCNSRRWFCLLEETEAVSMLADSLGVVIDARSSVNDKLHAPTWARAQEKG